MDKQLLQKILVWFVIFLLAPSATHAATFSQGTIYVEYGKTTTVTLPDYLIDEYNNWGAVPYSGGGTLKWSVSNSSLIIEVTANFYCKIRPRSDSSFPNYVTLTASFRSWHGTTLMETNAEWTVKLKEKVHVKSISLNTYSIGLGLGNKKQKQLVATVYPEDAEVKTVTWSSDNSNVATVDNTGLVTAQNEGIATITCEADDKTNNVVATCEVIVTKEDPVEPTFEFNDGVGVRMVSNATFHTLIVKEDGTLWACGDNRYGQLGDGTTTSSLTPIFIMNNVAIATTSRGSGGGQSSSFVVKNDGSLWTWGYNIDGQLGDGTFVERNLPMKITDGVSSVVAEAGNTYFIKTDGTLWGCGSNDGALGSINYGSIPTPVKILDNVRSIASKGRLRFVIRTDGSLWAWGDNEYGQLGDGTNSRRYSPVKIMEDVVSAVPGYGHSLALKNDGSLWAWGRNGYGQLGDGTTIDRSAPTKVSDNVVAFGAQASHTFFIKSDGSLWACGNNSDGQLCDGTYTNRSSPIKVMEDVAWVSPETYSTVIIKKDGSLWACGSDNVIKYGYSYMDDASDYSNRCNPVKILEDVSHFYTDQFEVCHFVIKEDRSLWAYGYNEYGQLGDASTENRSKPVEILKATVSAGIQSCLKNKMYNGSSIFTLSGQRLSTLRKGIVIIDGKKVMVK